MRIFIDIGHPAHVHYFKNFIKIMSSKGHVFLITSRNKEMAQYLLEKEGIKYIDRGFGKKTAIGKIFYMFTANTLLLNHAIKFKPDIFIGFANFYTAQVSSLIRKPSIIIDDTENGKFQQLFYRPFANFILSPSTFSKDFGRNHFKFNSYLELAYLHPEFFSPCFSELKELNLEENEKFTFCRFVSWNANHDYGHTGISSQNKILAVKEFSRHGKVFVSSESEIPDEIKQYKINLAPEKIHHVLSFASLVYGESATMASESAVLGTPAIYIDNDGRGYTDEQEKKYGIVFNYDESKSAQIRSINKGCEILSKSKVSFKKRNEKILADKINFTNFLVWFIESYPKSKVDLKKKPLSIKNFT